MLKPAIATTSRPKNSSICLANSALFGEQSAVEILRCRVLISFSRQIRQGNANNTKGTAFVVYEDVVDAKQACDKLNGFNFQNRYLVGMCEHWLAEKENS